MNKKLVDKYIGMTLAYKVFGLDVEEFKQFKMSPVYLDKLDAATSKLKDDFYALKKELITKYHLDVKMISGLEYKVNGKTYTYTTDQLKDMTKETMRYYLATVDYEPTNRGWEN